MESNNPETAILKHQEIYDGKIVRLFVDTIQLESGAKAIREVVLHPGGVVAVPVLDDGRILLVRQFRYPLGKYILELPAGKLDSDQPPHETMARELTEEIGRHAESIEYQFSFYTTPGISNEIIHFFLARKLSPVTQQLQEGEHITIEAYQLSECLQKIESGEIADGKTVLGILWYLRKLGST
jgi:ADP-ribose pyrophosphatase